MSWKGNAARAANAVLRPFGSELVLSSQLEDLKARAGHRHHTSYTNSAVPDGARERLTRDNPRLVQLQKNYRGHPAAMPTQWDRDYLQTQLDLAYFRGDNAYLYQQSVASDARYLLSAFYLKGIDRLKLFDLLTEDQLFGNYVVALDNGQMISRDLLDSIAEITFLEETLSLSRIPELEIVDIGAGYGRLAYRLCSTFPNITRVWCADAVAESTFLSEYYLAFRQADKARVLELESVDDSLRGRSIHLATNIHSFSECSLQSIRWWLDLVARHEVRYLFIVPNDDRLLSTESDRSRREFLPDIEARGYRLITQRPKYAESGVQTHGAFPAQYYLFERG